MQVRQRGASRPRFTAGLRFFARCTMLTKTNRRPHPMRKLSLIAASCAALLAFPAIAADVPVIVKIPRLTVEASEKLARAAMDACRKQGIQIGVTVVDRSGDAMVVMRDTLAPRVTLPISQQIKPATHPTIGVPC